MSIKIKNVEWFDPAERLPDEGQLCYVAWRPSQESEIEVSPYVIYVNECGGRWEWKPDGAAGEWEILCRPSWCEVFGWTPLTESYKDSPPLDRDVHHTGNEITVKIGDKVYSGAPCMGRYTVTGIYAHVKELKREIPLLPQRGYHLDRKVAETESATMQYWAEADTMQKALNRWDKDEREAQSHA